MGLQAASQLLPPAVMSSSSGTISVLDSTIKTLLDYETFVGFKTRRLYNCEIHISDLDVAVSTGSHLGHYLLGGWLLADLDHKCFN